MLAAHDVLNDTRLLYARVQSDAYDLDPLLAGLVQVAGFLSVFFMKFNATLKFGKDLLTYRK